MSDYISREDVLKGQKTGTFANGVALEAMRCVPVGYIESIEPADVVPVVRCRDCKHWKEDGNYSYCSVHDDYIMGADEFCSYGERKE